jgi:hypothetical protein
LYIRYCYGSETVFVHRGQAQNSLCSLIFEHTSSFSALHPSITVHSSSQALFFSISLWLFLHQASILYYKATFKCQPSSDLFHLLEASGPLSSNFCLVLYFLQSLEEGYFRSVLNHKLNSRKNRNIYSLYQNLAADKLHNKLIQNKVSKSVTSASKCAKNSKLLLTNCVNLAALDSCGAGLPFPNSSLSKLAPIGSISKVCFQITSFEK